MASPQDDPRTSVKFRVIHDEDFDQVVKIIKAVGFPQSRKKLEFLIREGHSDFYVLEDINNGSIVGVACVSKTRPGEAVLGSVVVRKECRSQGLGSYLMHHVLSLYDDLTVNWFSTSDNFYRRLGCKFSCPQSACLMAVDFKRDKVKEYCQENVPEYSVTTIKLTEDRREDLIRYDTECKGYDNTTFISALIGFADSIILAVACDDKRIVGYTAGCVEDASIIRLCGLYADDDKIAALLLRHMLMDSFPMYERAKLFTLYSRRFLAQFGDTIFIHNQERASTGQKVPSPIPESKVFCLSDGGVCY